MFAYRVKTWSFHVIRVSKGHWVLQTRFSPQGTIEEGNVGALVREVVGNDVLQKCEDRVVFVLRQVEELVRKRRQELAEWGEGSGTTTLNLFFPATDRTLNLGMAIVNALRRWRLYRPKLKAVVFMSNPKKFVYLAYAWHHSILVWLLGRSSVMGNWMSGNLATIVSCWSNFRFVWADSCKHNSKASPNVTVIYGNVFVTAINCLKYWSLM